MIQKLLLFFCFVTLQLSIAQETFELKGKIVSQSSSLQNINILNDTRGTGTFSDEYGNFKLNVAVNDTLFITAIFIKPLTYVVLPKDKIKQTLYLPVENNVNNLDEVTLLEYKSITPEKLRIIPYGIKVKTYSERRLATARSGILDPLINAITGKTKRLKKELEIERKELLREEIMLDYNEQFIQERIKIPEAYVNGFYYYLIEQPDFIAVYKSKNQAKTEYAIIAKGQEYLNIISKK